MELDLIFSYAYIILLIYQKTPPSRGELQIQNQQLLEKLNALEAIIISMKTDITALKEENLIWKKGEATENGQPSNEFQSQFETDEDVLAEKS